MKRPFRMFVNYLLSYIKFIDWLIVYLLSSVYRFFYWIFIASDFITILQEEISLFICKKIIILYPVHWLIVSWLIQFYMLSFYSLNKYSWYVYSSFTRIDLFVCFENDHYLISNFVDSLLTLICMLMTFIWISEVCMSVDIFKEVMIAFCNCVMIYILIAWFLLN